MKMPKYVLVASGHVTTPTLTISMRGDVLEDVRENAVEIVQQLTPAGYFSFTLYEVGKEIDVYIESYRSEVQKPVVTTYL
ncbi:hypothetical protein PHIM7_69 [Sinorhizobium phage phiM7]|uniref:Uncharacterized protein n=3 Tax=Emdodecavirus TaxID=1980937 RepID=S5MV31_9CAUD|nr:hypothetical protein AB690_gp075 [Sinorhizobium phage phiM12]YP_009212325.1 hypothetical protein AVT40_gp085 [Sinorhizobium phage phiN3]YP_009601194.1 hypothetical protein FDH46_gp069 [Sinorhizobium phage phiM7]AKF12977.1 hypothetical protein PHIM19_70 [Sinorhizobium phage phiM19]AGR47722.1 hypothetical protein SmphiM12_090 [Sinorhizobium phage phiM12]AKF12617.1 hypothetical protein PHIM7_69 [Sinorhizobium phage phiM7]AKF13349.1 hypothetical protein PHIN3_85 [Sinorhizobium phage phiN3]